MKTINILEIIYLNPKSTNSAGLENYAVNLSRFLEEHRVITTFVYLKDQTNDKFKDNDISVNVPNIPFLRKILFNIKLYYLFRKKLKFEKYDAIHINGDNGAFLSSFKNINTLFTSHGSQLQYIYTLIKNRISKPSDLINSIIQGILELYAYKNSKFVFSVSENNVLFMNKFYRRNNVIISPPAADKIIGARDREALKNRLGFDEKSMICIWVGKEPRRKGLYTAINAVKDKENIKLIIVGPKDKPNNLPDNCKYYGVVKNETLEDLYSISDVLLFPSIYEGFPTVVIEAMSYGVIPIVYNRRPFNEIITNNLGYLASDDNKFLIILNKIIDNKKELETKKNLCKIESEKFRSNVIFKKYLEVLNSMK